MQHPTRKPERPTRKRITVWVVLCTLPVIAAFGLQWLPIFNGPHLFFGLPTILWWSCVPGSALVTLVLVIVENTRTDNGRQHRLDDEAARIAAGDSEGRSAQ